MEVKDGNDGNKTVDSGVWGKVFLLETNTGWLNITDNSTAVTFYIYLAATGKDGMNSSKSATQNVVIHLYDPPPAIVIPPEFNLDVVPKTNADKELVIEKSVQSNKDVKIFDDKKVNTVKQYYTMFFPGTIDVQQLPVTMNIVSGLETKWMEYNSVSN